MNYVCDVCGATCDGETELLLKVVCAKCLARFVQVVKLPPDARDELIAANLSSVEALPKGEARYKNPKR